MPTLVHPDPRPPFGAVRALRAVEASVALALLCASLAFAGGARAGGYVALDGSSVTLGRAADEDLDLRGGRLRLGLRVSEAFDVELQAGASGDAATGTHGRFDASWAGAYLKGYLPVGERSALFALAGVAGVSLARSFGDVEITDELGGFSFGAGLETRLTDRLDLSADWMRYADGAEGLERVDAVSLGLKLYF